MVRRRGGGGEVAGGAGDDERRRRAGVEGSGRTDRAGGEREWGGSIPIQEWIGGRESGGASRGSGGCRCLGFRHQGVKGVGWAGRLGLCPVGLVACWAEAQ